MSERKQRSGDRPIRRALRVSRSRPDLDRDVRDELDFYIEMRARELVEQGIAPDEARRRAAESFGDRHRIAGDVRRVAASPERRRRLAQALAELGCDVRLALRTLRRAPGFATVAVAILALGIGANAAVFSVVNSVLLRPLVYPDPERLVQVWETDRRQDSRQDPVSPVDLVDWRSQVRTLEALAGYGYEALSFAGEDAPERVIAVTASASFFRVLGTEPALGRGFLPGEEGPGSDRVAVLSDGFWRSHLGADPRIVGQRILLDRLPYTVIGVMPPETTFPSSAELWIPFAFDVDDLNRGTHFLFAIGRLGAGVTLGEAQSEMSAIAARLEEEYPGTNSGHGVNLRPLHQQLVGEVQRQLWVLLGAVALVLLIGCCNVGNLLLARTVAGQRDVAIRSALGAGRWRLVRQIMTETLVLALVAGVAGIVVAFWGVALLESISAGRLPRAAEIGIDGGILAFTLLVTLATGLVFAVGPAANLLRRDRAGRLNDSDLRTTSGRGARWLRGTLVVSEVAMTLVLLIAAGLLLGNVARLQNVDPGFRASGILTARISLPDNRYPEFRQQAAFVSELLTRVGALGGVESYGAVDSLPFSGSRSSTSFDIEGELPNPDALRSSDVRLVSPGYLRTMGIPLLSGRELADSDGTSAPLAILVNREFARRFFGTEEVLGRRIQLGRPQEIALYGEPVWREIVGVVGDIIHDDLTAGLAPEIYVPYAQQPSTRIALALRARGEPEGLVAALRDAVLQVDPAQPIYDVATMEERLSRFLTVPRINAQVLGSFSVAALVLAVLGIYSVVSYAVTLRTRELGVRVALGARGTDVMRLVLGQGMRQVGLGLGLGLGGALLVAGLIRSLLFNVSPTDPATLLGAAGLLAAVGFIACWVPARRALRVDPIEALRTE